MASSSLGLGFNMTRVLKRPLGGWNARAWRRGVLAWLLAAVLYLSAAATCTSLYGLLNAVAH